MSTERIVDDIDLSSVFSIHELPPEMPAHSPEMPAPPPVVPSSPCPPPASEGGVEDADEWIFDDDIFDDDEKGEAFVAEDPIDRGVVRHLFGDAEGNSTESSHKGRSPHPGLSLEELQTAYGQLPRKTRRGNKNAAVSRRWLMRLFHQILRKLEEQPSHGILPSKNSKESVMLLQQHIVDYGYKVLTTAVLAASTSNDRLISSQRVQDAAIRIAGDEYVRRAQSVSFASKCSL
jgi:hypothetical protein